MPTPMQTTAASEPKSPWYLAWRDEPTRPAVDLDDPLGGALDDALVLLAFTAQSRRNFQKEKIVALTVASQALQAKRAAATTPTPEELGEFWSAYDDLAVAAAPASAQSIRATIAFNQKRFPRSLFSATGANGFIALIAFVACVALQGFWSAGRDLLAKVDAFDEKKVEMQKRMQDNKAVHVRAEEKYLQLRERLCEKAKCADTGPTARSGHGLPSLPSTPLAKDEETRLRAEALLARADFMDKRASANELAAQHERIRLESTEVEHSISRWRDKSYLVCRLLVVVCPIHPDDPESLPKGDARTAFLQSADARVASNSRSYLPTTSLAFPDTAPAASFRDTLQQMRVNLTSIGNYWIPMFMGLLGAMTFILRSLTLQLREYVYVPRSISVSVIRICLGAVAGVFGALLSPSTEGALKGLPPLFIPFVFGYGIEILFSLMDNVVTSFTHGDGPDNRTRVLG